MKVGYADFVRLCRVDDPKEVAGWLELRKDGVYVKEPDADLFFLDREALTDMHPTGDLSQPALRFPIDFKVFAKELERLHIYDRVDPFGLATWVMERLRKDEAPAREMPSHLRVIGALLELLTEGKPRHRNQSSVIDEIQEKRKVRGLSTRNLEDVFSTAKKALHDAEKE